MSTTSPKPSSKAAPTPYSNRGFPAQFLCMVPRYEPLILDGVIASLDNVRIKFTFQKSLYDFSRGQRCDTLVKTLYALTSEVLYAEGLFNIDVGKERSFKIGSYQRTVTYSYLDEWSFAVMVGRFCYDSSVKQLAPEAILDFNPNKVPIKAWKRIYTILAAYAVDISVSWCNLALDFPIERSTLSLQKRSGSERCEFENPSGDLTQYTGKRSHHGGIKLYDKAAEVGADCPCSRLEITIDPSRYKGVKKMLPTVLTTSPLDLSMEFDSLPFCVKAVLLHPDSSPLLKDDVSRNTWAKYNKQIQQYSLSNSESYLTLSDANCKEVDRYFRDYLARLKRTDILS